MASANAATVTVAVTDREGTPVGDTAIYAVPIRGERPAPAPAPASPVAEIMDQREQTFVPHVLVVETGTAVEFPNHDTVSHHVYSFSDAKSFELPLYSGRAHAPIAFDTPGVVDIGCNIHDHMEAHVVVVDTPYFAVTSDRGDATLTELPPGEYSVHVYSPRLPAKSQMEPLAITISDTTAHLDVQFDKRLRPSHTERNQSLQWSHY